MRPLEEELHTTAAARAELGDDYDRAVVRSPAARLEAELEARDRGRRLALMGDVVTVVIALGSIGLGVLVGAAADGLGETGATAATIVAWVAIALINGVHAKRRP
jgi:uncharacterized membrane protein YqjE